MFYMVDKNEMIFGEGIEKLKNFVFSISKKIPNTEPSHKKLMGILFNPKFRQKRMPVSYVEEVLSFLESLEEYKQELENIKNQIKKDIENNFQKNIIVDYDKIKDGKISIETPEEIPSSIKIQILSEIVKDKKLERNKFGKYEVGEYIQGDEANKNIYYVEESLINLVTRIISDKLGLKIIFKGNKRSNNQQEPQHPQEKIEKKEELPKAPKKFTEREERLRFYDESNGTDDKILIREIGNLNNHDRLFVRELIKYNLKDFVWNSASRTYRVRGDYKQYAKVGTLLRKFGYKKEIADDNVNGLKYILKNKIKNGGVKQTEHDGQLPENFRERINFPNFGFSLFEAQKDGIEFLYGRRSAILGDEAGVGKTITTTGAAELRMQDIGPDSKTLIITLKSLVGQWVSEIVGLLGEQERSKISTMPMKPNKWTIVYYDNFSSGSLKDMIFEKLKSTKFSIVIFDELHRLKHEDTLRSKNVLEVTKDIPYKWGASATVSSNQPLDVRFQLQIVGHQLGKMPIDRFKQDFTGMIRSGRGFKKGPLEETIRAAERLNKWLNLSGVYIRRSKSDLRDMPPVSVDIHKTDIDEKQFITALREKLSGYSNPSLKISELIASREVLANLKAPATVKKAMQVVRAGLSDPSNNYAASKVVIFTCFVKPGRTMEKSLQDELDKIDSKFFVLTYLGGDSSKEIENIKNKFIEDPNAKILILSMKRGGTGLSFPNAAKTLIVNDFDWTPESGEQSEGRIYRINTNQSVNILYTLVDGLDTDLYEAVMRKRKIAEIVQKFRKEFQTTEFDDEVLKQIVTYQKQAEKINKEIQDMIEKANQKALPANVKESLSFKDLINKDLFLLRNIL
jgi:superfamily II DNA or RNA helicase